MLGCAAFVNLVYLVAPFVLYTEEIEFPYITFGFHTFATVMLTRLVLNSILSGYDYEYYYDLLVINLVTQLSATFSDKAYFLFAIVSIGIFWVLMSGSHNSSHPDTSLTGL